MALHPYHVRTVSAGRLDRSPEWIWDSPGFDGRKALLWIISGGKGSLRAGTRAHSFVRGDCFISDLRTDHHGRQDPEHLAIIPWVVFEFIDPLTGSPISPEPWPRWHRHLTDTSFAEQLLMRAVGEHLDAGGPTDAGNAFLRAALFEVIRQEQHVSYFGEELEQYRTIERLVALMRREPGQHFRVESMARHLHCTPDHFIRLFKKFKGTTPNDFAVRVRLEEAQRLLLFTNQTVAAIAEALGYSDVSFFSRQFTAKLGVSPRRFRRGL
ncbi:MAG: helix-turn-helix domain-containing protein [Chitinivibrionales bacterium]|nr:helix-turn-helix domain-containing protein [Chitinivibrionales bacterium]